MVMKCVCTHKSEEQAELAAKSLENIGCETEVFETSVGTWGVMSDGKLSTRTVMEKF